jgi:hypothetical protein
MSGSEPLTPFAPGMETKFVVANPFSEELYAIIENIS